MPEPRKHSHKKSYYNDIALRLANKLLGLEHLHYGYFKQNVKKDLEHLPQAQAEYVKNLLSFIPRGVKKVFDVGCGTGGVAKELVKKRYELTCLAPDPFLIEKTQENTGNKVKTITELYENVHDLPAAHFDLVLMSESCQYIKVKEGWEQNRKYLRDGGHVLIADFFRIRKLDRPGLSKSGHVLEDFLQAAADAGFRLLKKKDITREVAPTMDIYQDILTNKVFPVFEAAFEFLSRKYPMIYRLLNRSLSRKVLKLKDKYSNQGSEIFKTYKGYFVLLFVKEG